MAFLGSQQMEPPGKSLKHKLRRKLALGSTKFVPDVGPSKWQESTSAPVWTQTNTTTTTTKNGVTT